jgi:hypothetical protein
MNQPAITNEAQRSRKPKKFRVSVTLSIKLRDTPYQPLRETRKAQKNRLDEFASSIAWLHVLGTYLYTLKATSFGNETGWKYKVKKGATGVEFLRYSEVLTPTIGLCANEFVVFLSELQTGTYSGAARTLRYILELAVASCEFQMQPRRTTLRDIIGAYKKKSFAHLITHDNAWSAFLERSRIYEETKRIAPTFKELVNRLNSTGTFQDSSEIGSDLKSTYEMLSDHVHPSSAWIERQLGARALQPVKYNPGEFRVIYDAALRVLDMVIYLYVKSGSHYQNFGDAREFLGKMSHDLKIEQPLARVFMKLAYSGRLARDLEWRTLLNDKQHQRGDPQNIGLRQAHPSP